MVESPNSDDAKGHQRAAAASLPVSNALVGEILESVSDGFVAIDRQWRFAYVNQAYLELVAPLYKSADELVGFTLWECFPDIVGSEVAQLYQRVMATGVPEAMELLYEPLNRFLEVRVFASAEMLTVYVRDITVRKRQEADLARLNRQVSEQAHLFDSILSNTPDLAYAFDRDLRVIYANKALLDLWGRPLAEVVGKDCLELDYPPDLAAELMGNMRRVIETKEPLWGETFYLGEYHEYVYSPSFGPAGEVVAVVGTTRFVTARRRAEAAADGHRRALQLIVENAPLEAVFNELAATVERQMPHDARVAVLVSDERRERLFVAVAPRLPPEYVSAANGLPIAPDSGASGSAAWQKQPVFIGDILADPRSSHMSDWARLLGARSCWSTPILSTDGELLGTIAVYSGSSDVPAEEDARVIEIATRTAAVAIERKRAYADLTGARDEAVAASRAKDEFLAALSHELRSPLNPVLLLASEGAEDPSLPQTVRETFLSIRKNVRLEARLIDDLLDLTRITQGKMSLERQPVRLHAILRDAIESSRAELDAKRHRLTLALEADCDSALGDPTRLQQIFWNVIKNAVKFTPDGGAIRVQTRRSALPGCIEIVVTDSGMGMTPNELESAFDSFAQGEHAAPGGERSFGGLGLGLSISSRLARLHGGDIAATSAGRDRGSTFVITLPLTEDGLDPAQTRSVGSAPVSRHNARFNGAGRRLLLVDDDPATRRVLELLLRSRGFAISVAGTVAAARAAAAAERFDLLLSDIGLPDGDGYQLMSELAAAYGLRGVALSGYGMRKDRDRSAAAGFVAHLVKPVDVQALDAVLALALT